MCRFITPSILRNASPTRVARVEGKPRHKAGVLPVGEGWVGVNQRGFANVGPKPVAGVHKTVAA